MQLFHWHAPRGNFGDDMNQWFWDDVLPGWRDWTGAGTLIGVGSLLTTGLALPPGLKVVAGAGAGYGEPPPMAPGEWDFRFVRGPRTAAALGLPPSAALTDSAVMTARLPRFAERAVTGGTLFVPHWESDVHPDYDWPAICRAAGIGYLSPRGDSQAVIRAIAGARLVLAESLHAAILADAFRVPWRPVRSGVGGFKLFKWLDWTESMEVPFEALEIFGPITRLRGILRRAPAPASAAGGPPKAPAFDPEAPPPAHRPAPSLRSRLRDRVRATVAARELARAARLAPFLSADAVLEARLDRGAELLRGLARDYGA